MQIPPNVHEDILKWIFDHEMIEEDNLLDTQPCPYIAHLQTKKQITPACCKIMFPITMDRFTDTPAATAYNHIKNGHLVVGIVQPHTKCAVQLSILVPCDESDQRMVIIPHLAPPQPSNSHTSQGSISTCVVASRVVGMTPAKFDNGNP